MAHKLEITRRIGDNPVRTHGGLARTVYWTLKLNGVQIGEDSTRCLWDDDTSNIPIEPASLARLRERVQKGLDATGGEADRRMPRLEPPREGMAGSALDANTLADAFDCFWNAAIGESHSRQEGAATAAIIATGFAAVAAHLRSTAELMRVDNDGEKVIAENDANG